MNRIRFHGRGGQGAVVASQIFASTVLRSGKYAQSMPFYGTERRGAPVTAFVRIDDRMILERGIIEQPDYVVILDTNLLRTAPVTKGLKEGAWIVLNSPQKPGTFVFEQKFRVATIDANTIARKHRLGSAMSPVVNTTMLGALARITGLVSLDAMLETIREEVPAYREENVRAANEGYEEVRK